MVVGEGGQVGVAFLEASSHSYIKKHSSPTLILGITLSCVKLSLVDQHLDKCNPSLLTAWAGCPPDLTILVRSSSNLLNELTRQVGEQLSTVQNNGKTWAPRDGKFTAMDS